MTTVARIRGDQVSCWHCPCTLGQIVEAAEDAGPFVGGEFTATGYRPRRIDGSLAAMVPALATHRFYRASTDPRLPGVTILTIPDRVKARLATTDMPDGNRRRRTLDSRGAMPREASVIVALPVLIPCWRPGCGQLNRIDMSVASQ